MKLKEEFIQKVRESEEAEKPDKYNVYFDTDLEVLILSELKATYNIEDKKFILNRGDERMEFKVEHIENRFGSDVEETLITLE